MNHGLIVFFSEPLQRDDANPEWDIGVVAGNQLRDFRKAPMV